MHGVSVGRYVGVWGEVRREVGKGKERCRRCKDVWESWDQEVGVGGRG